MLSLVHKRSLFGAVPRPTGNFEGQDRALILLHRSDTIYRKKAQKWTFVLQQYKERFLTSIFFKKTKVYLKFDDKNIPVIAVPKSPF